MTLKMHMHDRLHRAMLLVFFFVGGVLVFFFKGKLGHNSCYGLLLVLVWFEFLS